MEYQKLVLGEEPYVAACIKGSYPQHCHNEIEIVYCISGTVTFVIEDTEYTLKENNVLFVDSLAMHRLVIEDDAMIFYVEFGMQFLDKYFYEFAGCTFTSPLLTPQDNCEYSKTLINLLHQIYKEHQEKDSASSLAIKGYLNVLIAMMARYLPKSDFKKNSRKKRIERFLRIKPVFDYVKTNYKDNISVDTAAEYVGYNPNAFCRLFKEITGMSFHQYLNFHRVNIAMKLLEQKIYSIGTIGEQVGIPSTKTFNRVFKTYAGISPRDYRHKLL